MIKKESEINKQNKNIIINKDNRTPEKVGLQKYKSIGEFREIN